VKAVHMSFLLYRVNGSKATHGSHTKNRQRIFVLFVTIPNPCFAYMYFFRREKPEHDQGIRGNDRVTLWRAGASGPEIAGGHAFGLHNHRVARQRPSDTLVGWCHWQGIAGASGPGIAGGRPFDYIIPEWQGNDRVTLWWPGGGSLVTRK
jgi:hypothetical protein